MAENKKIQFVFGGKRRVIYPGKLQPREFDRMNEKIKRLAYLRDRGHEVGREIMDWLDGLSDIMAKKLASHGLIEQREPIEVWLDAFCTSYIRIRSDIKESSRANLNVAKNRLVAFFGADKDISTITKADVTELKAGLLEKYAEATVGRTLKRGKQFFAHAVDSKIMDVNPFDNVRVPGQSNKERMYFVNREVSKKVLDACPDKWWRLIFSLARYGGLRIPSELVGLKWSDILWDRERIRIESPKTARIGKGERLIPMFPELKGILQECFEAASEKAIYIFDRKITIATNLRKRLFGIIRNSGEKPWPKLFQNLRASRETELAGEYPIHVTTSWLGNSPAVAMAHYLQVTDADFLKASMGVSISGDMGGGDHSKSVSLSTSLDAKTTQNPSHRGGSQVFAEVQQLLENPEVMKNLAVIAGELQNGKMTSLGLEQMRFLAEILKKILKMTQNAPH